MYKRGRKRTDYSVDRKDPNKGYSAGNCRLLVNYKNYSSRQTPRKATAKLVKNMDKNSPDYCPF